MRGFSMSAAQDNIVVLQGETFVQTVIWTDQADVAVDITNYTPRMQVRETKEATAIIIDFTTVATPIAVSDGPNGEITITLSATESAALASGRLGLYDLEIESPAGVVTRLIEGEFTVDGEVTR